MMTTTALIHTRQSQHRRFRFGNLRHDHAENDRHSACQGIEIDKPRYPDHHMHRIQ